MKLYICLLFAALLILSQGCASYMAHQKLSKDIGLRQAIESGDVDAIRVARAGGNLEEFEIKPSIRDSYVENRWLMIGANLVDVLAVGYVGNELLGSSSSSSGRDAQRSNGSQGTHGGAATSVNVSGNSGEVSINVGQSSARDTQQTTTTTTMPPANNFIMPPNGAQ